MVYYNQSSKRPVPKIESERVNLIKQLIEREQGKCSNEEFQRQVESVVVVDIEPIHKVGKSYLFYYDNKHFLIWEDWIL